MADSLHAYAHLEDAWAGGVEAWCRESSGRALSSGTRSWLVCATRGQGEWVKARLLHAGLPLVGLELLDPSRLRRRLCALLRIDPPGTGRELLELLVRWHGRDDAAAKPAAENPAAWLNSLGELAEAGWLDEEGVLRTFVPPSLRTLVRELRDSPHWLPGIDQRLLASAAKDERKETLAPQLCLLGFDPQALPLTNLLTAAIHFAASSQMFVPSPRAGNESLHESWLVAFESALKAEIEPTDSLADAPYDPLIRRLEGVDLDGKIPHTPNYLVAVTWNDQIELITDSIAKWLEENPGVADSRLVVVVPGRGATSIAVSRRLSEVGIAHDDALGERPEPSWPVRLQRAIVDYLLDGSSGAGLLRLLAVRESASADGHLLLAEDSMRRRHEVTQRTEARNLVREDLSAEVVATLRKWDGELSVREARDRWNAAIAALALPGGSATQAHNVLEPAWSALDETFSKAARIPAKLLLEFLDSALTSIPAAGFGSGLRTRHARVVIANLRDAAAQTWHHVIVADANEGIWPVTPIESRFLPEDLRAVLNARRGDRRPLITRSDKMRLEESLFLSLLENCAGEFQFAAACRKADSPNLETHPSEWVLRCLVEGRSAEDNPADFAGEWAARRTSLARVGSVLPPTERQHLYEIHQTRRDPTKPFDEYFHNYQSLASRPQPPPPLSARDVEKLEHTPAQLALKLVFAAESRRASTAFASNDRAAIGRSMHQWIDQSLRRPENASLDSSALQEAIGSGLARVRDAHERNLRRELGLAPDHELPSWWRSVLDQAERLARRCLESLRRSGLGDGTLNMEIERTQTGSISTPDGATLHLTGRFDLLLRDALRIQVLDFKSGKSAGKISAAKMLSDGADLQFVAYLWLALAMDSATAQVGLITPDLAQADLLTGADAESFQEFLAKYAAMHSNWSFGQSAGIAGRFETHEELPIATVPVAVRTLARKAALFGWVMTGKSEESDE